MAQVQKLGRDIHLRVAIERYDIVNGDGSGLKARVSFVKSGSHVEYTIRVRYEAITWTIQRRFAEVAALQDVLRRRLASVPHLPAKSAVRQFSTEYLEHRKAGLSDYLQELCKRRDVLNCREVQEFFGLHAHVARFRQPQSSEPVLAAEVHEAVFNVTDFVYEPMLGLLLLGASETSWSARIDTRLTNIQMPWESAAPNLPVAQMSLWRQSSCELRFDMLFTCRYSYAISRVVLCPDGDRGVALCGLGNGTVGCYAISGNMGVNTAGATLPLLKHSGPITGLAADHSQGWIISAGKDKAVVVYDMRRKMIISEVRTAVPTSTIAYCPERKLLFCGLITGRVVVWDTSNIPLHQVTCIPDGSDRVTNSLPIAALDFDSDASMLLTGAKEGLKLWGLNYSSGAAWARCVGTVHRSHGSAAAASPTAIAWAASSREIICGFSNGGVVVFDIDSGEATFAFQAHYDEIAAMRWLDAPRRLLTASRKCLKIWDFPSMQLLSLEEQFDLDDAEPVVTAAPCRTSNGSLCSIDFVAGGADREGGSSSSAADSFVAVDNRRRTWVSDHGEDPLLGLVPAGAPAKTKSSVPVAKVEGEKDPPCKSADVADGATKIAAETPVPRKVDPVLPKADPLSGGTRRFSSSSVSSSSSVGAYGGRKGSGPALPAPLAAPQLADSFSSTSARTTGSLPDTTPPTVAAAASPAPAAPAKRTVARAKPSDPTRGDSDDELVGWDT